jgi:hypothetical protein
MKQKIALGLFVVLAFITLCSSSGGYGSNRTGVRGGTTGCGSCHGSTTSIGTTIELDSAGISVSSYRPGGSYTVKLKATNATGLSLPAFGCQMSVTKLANAGTSTAAQAGTWGTMPTGMQNSGGTPTLIEQSQPLNPLSGTGANGTVYSISVPWTAPVAGTGSVKLYGLINAVNNNGGDDTGDKAQVAPAVTITEATVVAPVASVSIAITSGANPTCSGSSVTFTATPTNGGAAPTYQWKVGATVVGTGSTYTSTSLANGNVVTCVMTSNLAGVTGSPATSNAITMTINPSVTASVSIAATATTICSGTSVTFTATPTNGGTPTYQWKVGTAVVGTGATYTSTTLANGNVVTCVMTPTGTCVTPATSTSNAITMTVNPSVTASVSIAATATTICSGTSVTFTATPTNGGTPTYQWKVGTTVVGTGATYTSSTLANGNVVTCVMTPTGACVTPATATSNAITMTVNATGTDSVQIAATATTICAGTSVTFTATPFNGGASPTYQWKVGTTVVGTGATYTSTTLANGNVVTCVMTPSGSCASPATSTSRPITMTVNPSVVDSVNITSTATTICSGSIVTFTAHPFNGGATPSYQWKVGTTVVGTGVTYSSSTLANGNVVTCVMTPTGCAIPATATSNAITMTVNPTGRDSVRIAASSTSICAGTSVTFTATPFNGGASPTYQWLVGSTVVGTGSTYTTSTLSNGNAVSCIMTPSGGCATPATSNSNVIIMTVNSAPVTDSVRITSNATTICAGTSVTFTAQPFNGGANPTYQWKVGTTVVGTGSTYTSTTLANGNVVTCIMTPSGTCVTPATSTSNAITITVSSTVAPTITIAGNTSICSGGADTITAQISGGGNSPSFAWQINGSPAGTNSSSLLLPSVTSASAITCTLTSSSTCASPTAVTSNTLNVSVSTSSSATINITTPQTSVCQGSPVLFNTSVTGQGSNPHYQWYINTTPSGNSNTMLTSSLFNHDTVRCVLTSSSSCATQAQVTSNVLTMTVNAVPNATLVPSGNVSVCTGDSVLLTAGGGTSYQWSNNKTTSTLWVSLAGNYDVTVTDANGCTASPVSAATVATQSAIPPTITQSGNVIISSAAVSYQWQFNGSLLQGDTAQSLTITQSGSYLVYIVDANGCRGASAPNIFTFTPDTTHSHVGVQTLSSDLGVKLYPVPNQGSFMIDMPEYTGAQLMIYDMYGKALYQQAITTSHQEVSGLGLSPALYIVRIASGSKMQTIKMQVTRE